MDGAESSISQQRAAGKSQILTILYDGNAGQALNKRADRVECCRLETLLRLCWTRARVNFRDERFTDGFMNKQAGKKNESGEGIAVLACALQLL